MTISSLTFVQPLASDNTHCGKVVVVDITINSYTTLGEPFDIAQLGLSEVWTADISLVVPATGTNNQFKWDYTNKKILGHNAAGTAVSGAIPTVRARFYGLPS